MIEIITQNASWFWLALVVLFTVIELFTMGLTTIWFAIGAVIMIFLCKINISLGIQILIFLIISALLLFLTRPLAIKKLHIWKEKTNVNSLEGKKAIVMKTITEFEKGEIKLDGNIWSAKSINGSTIEANSECLIVKIEGVTAFVEKINK